jgi:hypothetical protein
MIAKFGAAALLAGVVLVAAPAAAQIDAGRKGGIEKQRAAKVAELPTCAKPIGTLGITEPEERWWAGLGLARGLAARLCAEIRLFPPRQPVAARHGSDVSGTQSGRRR